MIPPKPVWSGLAVSFLGTLVYFVLLVRWVIQRSRLEIPSGQVGIDVASLFKNELLYNAAYWLLVLGLFAAGYAMILLRQNFR